MNAYELAEERRLKYTVNKVYCNKHGIISTDQCYKTKSIYVRDGYKYACKECKYIYNQLQHFMIRLEALEHYGNKCKICLLQKSEFLCLDHINNDGYKFRKLNKGNIYRLIKRNGFIDNLQILCYNCNAIKQRQLLLSTNKQNKKAIETRIYREKIKTEVLNKYGLFCECCKENNVEKLTIDHPLSDGNLERKRINSAGGFWFYNYLKNNNYPNGYRTLCFNCNISIGHYRYCPHHQRPKLITELIQSNNKIEFINQYDGTTSYIL